MIYDEITCEMCHRICVNNAWYSCHSDKSQCYNYSVETYHMVSQLQNIDKLIISSTRGDVY